MTRLVVLIFQVSNRRVEAHIDELSNIFADKSPGKFRHNSEHLRPEIAVISLARRFPALLNGWQETPQITSTVARLCFPQSPMF